MLHLFRHLVLSLGFVLITFGLLFWHTLDFNSSNVWQMTVGGIIHPIFPTTLGLALVPASIWEIFLIQASAEDE
jgi:hypothetical protein